LPQSGINGRGEPPVLLTGETSFLIGIPVNGPFKKPVQIGTGECCLKNGSKKGLQKFWCSWRADKEPDGGNFYLSAFLDGFCFDFIL